MNSQRKRLSLSNCSCQRKLTKCPLDRCRRSQPCPLCSCDCATHAFCKVMRMRNIEGKCFFRYDQISILYLIVSNRSGHVCATCDFAETRLMLVRSCCLGPTTLEADKKTFSVCKYHFDFDSLQKLVLETFCSTSSVIDDPVHIRVKFPFRTDTKQLDLLLRYV